MNSFKDSGGTPGGRVIVHSYEAQAAAYRIPAY
jgi:hypothetical protein